WRERVHVELAKLAHQRMLREQAKLGGRARCRWRSLHRIRLEAFQLATGVLNHLGRYAGKPGDLYSITAISRSLLHAVQEHQFIAVLARIQVDVGAGRKLPG